MRVSHSPTHPTPPPTTPALLSVRRFQAAGGQYSNTLVSYPASVMNTLISSVEADAIRAHASRLTEHMQRAVIRFGASAAVQRACTSSEYGECVRVVRACVRACVVGAVSWWCCCLEYQA